MEKEEKTKITFLIPKSKPLVVQKNTKLIKTKNDHTRSNLKREKTLIRNKKLILALQNYFKTTKTYLKPSFLLNTFICFLNFLKFILCRFNISTP